MKGTIALVLCAIMLIVGFASCANTGEATLRNTDVPEQNSEIDSITELASDTTTGGSSSESLSNGESSESGGSGTAGGTAGGEAGGEAGESQQGGSSGGTDAAGSTQQGSGGADDNSNGADDEPGDALVENVYDTAFAIYPPDTVMIRTGELEVTWAEIFVYMHSIVSYLSSYYGEDPVDWSAPWDDETSCAEWVLQYAEQEALYNKALDYGAELKGVSLSDDDWAAILEENHNLAMDWGGEEEFLSKIWKENGFYSLELFNYYRGYNRLAELLLMAEYGEELELVTDAEVAEVTANDGFIMVKHIYIIKPEYGGSDDAYDRIEDILARLNAYQGEDFDGYFDELMYAYSEDYDGLERLPDGYLFQYGDMTAYFFDAAVALNINEISGIVDGGDGYHIIYRIPINYDVNPFSFAKQEDYRSLRELVAHSKFSMLCDDWYNMLTPEFTEEFKSIDISTMFKRA